MLLYSEAKALNKAVNERQQAGWTALSVALPQSCPRREKNNPLKNVEIIELKDGETRWDYMDN